MPVSLPPTVRSRLSTTVAAVTSTCVTAVACAPPETEKPPVPVNVVKGISIWSYRTVSVPPSTMTGSVAASRGAPGVCGSKTDPAASRLTISTGPAGTSAGLPARSRILLVSTIWTL